MKSPMIKRSDRLLTTGQVARYTGMSQQTVIRLIDAGRLKAIRIPGMRYRWIRADVAEAWAREVGLPWETDGNAAASPDKE